MLQTSGDPQHVYQEKLFSFHQWCHGKKVAACKATVQQISEFFLYLHQDLKLTTAAILGCRSTFNHVFTLIGTNLASSRVISRMFTGFEKSYLLRKIKPLEWKLSLVLRNLTCPPYEPVKLFVDKHLSWKTCFFLALTLVKSVTMSSLSFLTLWPRSRTPQCMIHDLRSTWFHHRLAFHMETEGMLFCLIRALEKYFGRNKQC